MTRRYNQHTATVFDRAAHGIAHEHTHECMQFRDRATVLRGVLTEKECKDLVAATHAHGDGYTPALVNTGARTCLGAPARPRLAVLENTAADVDAVQC